MLTIYKYDKLSLSSRKQLFTRPPMTTSFADVQQIIDRVKVQGDAAVRAFTHEFDSAYLSELKLDPQLIAKAQVTPAVMAALNLAISTIRHYHQAIKPKAQTVDTYAGVRIERVYRPIQRVGLYVPGGNNTPLLSSLLMQAIPAALAGCPIKVLCTPPDQQGNIHDALLVAARLCGIDTIFTVGGAQAIAAMAYGTESIPKVDKLFGPGNRFVTAAKTLVSCDPQGAAIDMPAGPSEVMVIADATANVDFVAADLLAQAEHGPDSQVILLCDSDALAQAVNCALAKQLAQLSRQAIIRKALAHSFIMIAAQPEQMVQCINNYAPEHLILNCADAQHWVPAITAAGTIFVGPWAAETLGDYLTGSNHILPTHGYARNYNSLATADFMTSMTVQSLSQQGLVALGQAACTLAQVEGLDAHANAVQQRLTFLEC